MAAANPRQDTDHPSAPPRPRQHLKTFLEGLALFSSLSLIVFMFLAIPIYPTFKLISISTTPLSTTTTNNATWNMSLKVSNPNRFWTISYDQSHVSLSYTDKDRDFETKVISETYLGPFVQRRMGQSILSPHLSVETDSVGKLLVERIVKDQTRGQARFQLKVTFHMRFKRYGDDWRMSNVFCNDINIVFNKNESGVASDLPMKCEFVGGW